MGMETFLREGCGGGARMVYLLTDMIVEEAGEVSGCYEEAWVEAGVSGGADC